MTGFDPVQTTGELQDGTERLAKAGDALYKAVGRYEQAEEAYELEMAKARLSADAEMPGGKLPSQDRRQDIALTAINREQPEVYSEFFAAKAHREALMVKYRALAASVSAAQTLLKAAQG